jgi:hypothetical protein
MSETKTIIQWLMDSPEPWTRYRTRVDLLGQPEEASEVQADRAQMVSDPQVQALISEMAAWGDHPIKRHNDAGYPIHKLSTLADFGLRVSDPGMAMIIDEVLTHQSPQGAFQTLVNIPRAFGGTGENLWTWMACDAPTLLYSLLAIGPGSEHGGVSE